MTIEGTLTSVTTASIQFETWWEKTSGGTTAVIISSKQWSDALKSKLFTDYDGVRCRILKVEYSRVYRSYIVDYHFVENGRETFQEELKPILELSRGEDWFIPAYEDYIGQ